MQLNADAVDRIHGVLCSRLDPPADYEVVAYSVLLRLYLIQEGYHAWMAYDSTDKTKPTAVAVTANGHDIRIYRWYGLRPSYTLTYYCNGTRAETIYGGVRTLVETLASIVEWLPAAVQCAACHYGDMDMEYCGMGLVGTGSCTHYKPALD